MCADYKESVLTFIQACFYKEVLQLLPLPSINLLSFLSRSTFFFKWKIYFFFPRWLFCLANFWGPLNNLEGNLDKKQNRSWISCMKQFLNSFKKTKEIFQRSSKWGSRTFGADVTLWYVTANEWQCKMSIFTIKCKQICFLLFLGLFFLLVLFCCMYWLHFSSWVDSGFLIS